MTRLIARCSSAALLAAAMAWLAPTVKAACNPPSGVLYDLTAAITGPDKVCVGSDATFGVTVNGPIASYSWGGGDDPSSGTSASYTTKWNTAGSGKVVSVTVVGSDPADPPGTCQATDTHTVCVVEVSKVQYLKGDGTYADGPGYVCIESGVTLKAVPSPCDFPSGSPDWSVASKPTGALVDNANLSDGNPVITVPADKLNVPGTYTFSAACGTSSQSITIYVLKVDLDINRKNGDLVPEDKEHSNGSVVQLVPQDNPSTLYPSGIFLDIPTMGVEPASAASSLTLKLKKVGPSTSIGKIRVYKNGSLFMDEDEMEKPLSASDLSATWKLDSTLGGVVNLSIIAEMPAGAELCRDTIRISSIPCDPGDGDIIFVNPAATTHAFPYDDFEETAADKIEDALAAVCSGAGDNIVVARSTGTYNEYDLLVSKDLVLAGAAGKWTVDDPADAASPTHPNPYATVFDFSDLPTVKGAKGHATPLATFNISADSVVLGGLHLTSGEDPDYGGAITADGLSRLTLCYNVLDLNTAPVGGAVYLANVQNGKITTCCFDNNIAEFHDSGVATLTKGFGGAVAATKGAAGNAHLNIDDCLFGQSTGNKAITTDGASGLFTAGSASGGGDVYQNKGSLSINFSQFQNSRAGLTMTAASTYEDMKEINAFTGDGGSIAVHGNQDDTQLTITDAEFNTTRAEGTGGAIYIARDADPANRALFTAWTGKFSDKDWARDNPTPDVLGGGCNGLLTRVTFTTCEAGVEGGGMILCGRGVQVVLDECNFSECKAGVVHETDGKGGAIAFGGGHHGTKSGDDNSPESHTPHGKMTIQGSTTIDQCTSSDNGGGIYLTISGEIEMNDTTINDCYALGSTGVAGHEPKCLEEGLGGGLHVSAGGMLRVRDGCTISENRARHSGGGIGCKNGLVDVAATATAITIVENRALEHTEDGGGYGGGIYLSTGANDTFGALLGLDALCGPGRLRIDDGKNGAAGRLITIKNNHAKQWAGGLYVGIPATYNADCVAEVNCCFSKNSCEAAGAENPYNATPLFPGWDLYPSEVVAHEQNAEVNMKTSYIEGLATAIGLYDRDSGGFSWATVTFNAGIGRQFEEDE